MKKSFRRILNCLLCVGLVMSQTVTGVEASAVPVISITSHDLVSHVSYKGLRVSGVASPKADIKKVELYVRDYARDEFSVYDASAPYNKSTGKWYFDILESHLTQGRKTKVFVRAIDKDGKGSQIAEILLYVGKEDEVPPKVKITLPSNGDVVPAGGFTVKGTATDTSGVSGVRLSLVDHSKNAFTLRNHEVQADSKTGVWSYFIEPEHFTPGSDVTFFAQGYDTFANYSSHARVQLHVSETAEADNTPPAVTITSPEDNDYVDAEGFSLSGTVTDDSDIKKVTLTLTNYKESGLQLYKKPVTVNNGQWSYPVASDLIVAGYKVKVYIQAEDEFGNVSKFIERSFYAEDMSAPENDPPVISFIMPSNNQECGYKGTDVLFSVTDESELKNIELRLRDAAQSQLIDHSSEVLRSGNDYRFSITEEMVTPGNKAQILVRASDEHDNESQWQELVINMSNIINPASDLSAQYAGDAVEIDWKDNSEYETGYKLYRKAEGNSFIRIADLPADTQNFTDVNVNENETYQYKAVAYDSFYDSDHSNIAEVTCTPIDDDAPLINFISPESETLNGYKGFPVSFRVSDNQSVESVKIRVQDKASGEYTEEKSLSLSADEVYTFEITADMVTPGSGLCVSVQAGDEAGNISGWAYLNLQISHEINTPTGLTGEYTGDSIILNWQDNNQAETGYRLFRKENSESSYAKIADIAADATEFTDEQTAEDIVYMYQIEAYDEFYVSDRSSAVTVDCSIADMELLDKMHAKSAAYAMEEAYPNGLIYDISNEDTKASISATGFGLAALAVAHKRAGSSKYWTYTKSQIEARVGTILDTLINIQSKQTQNYVTYGSGGFFYHFLDGNGRRFGNCEVSAIDNSILLAGLYIVKNYFGGTLSSGASSIISHYDWGTLYDLEKNWFSDSATPESGLSHNQIYRYYNSGELLLTAMISYSQNLDKSEYKSLMFNWARESRTYGGYIVYPTASGSMFTYYYAHAFFDFKKMGFDDPESVDSVRTPVNWWNNSVNAVLANRQFCINNAGIHSSYGYNSWGISATMRPDGRYVGNYGASPCVANGGVPIHDGTVTTTSAVAAMPLVAEDGQRLSDNLSFKVIKDLYAKFGDKMFDYSSYNSRDEHSCKSLGIDLLPVTLMIENYRSGFIWDTFMGDLSISSVTHELFTFEDELTGMTNMLIEAEDFTSKQGGTIDYKTNASNTKTIGGGWGRLQSDYAVYSVFLYESPNMTFKMRYSDDVPSNIVDIYLDGELKGAFSSEGTNGWNSFKDTDIVDLGAVSTGDHELKLVSRGGSYGINLDILHLRDARLIAPQVLSVEPPDGTGIAYEEELTVKVSASNPNQSDLKYRFSVNGTSPTQWLESNTFDMKDYLNKEGLKKINISVRDASMAEGALNVEYYVFRQPLKFTAIVRQSRDVLLDGTNRGSVRNRSSVETEVGIDNDSDVSLVDNGPNESKDRIGRVNKANSHQAISVSQSMFNIMRNMNYGVMASVAKQTIKIVEPVRNLFTQIGKYIFSKLYR